MKVPMTYGGLTYDDVRDITKAATACHYVVKLECSYVDFKTCGWKDYSGNLQQLYYSQGTIYSK